MIPGKTDTVIKTMVEGLQNSVSVFLHSPVVGVEISGFAVKLELLVICSYIELERRIMSPLACGVLIKKSQEILLLLLLEHKNDKHGQPYMIICLVQFNPCSRSLMKCVDVVPNLHKSHLSTCSINLVLWPKINCLLITFVTIIAHHTMMNIKNNELTRNLIKIRTTKS